MERRAVRGPLHKHFDLERKMAKQAEARLRQRLQSLEAICLYQVKLLTREQKQLQREQQRLQQGLPNKAQQIRSLNRTWRSLDSGVQESKIKGWLALAQADIVKARLSSSLGNGTQKRPEGVPRFPPQGGQKHRLPKIEIRALATNMTQEMYKINSHMPPLCHTGLKNPTGRKEHWPSQTHRTASFVAEKPQAQEKESASPPQHTDPAEGISVTHQDRAVSSSTAERSLHFHTPGASGMVHLGETRSKDANLKPGGSAAEQIPPSSMECAGGCKGETTKPSFSELFAKAKNAHYLRHRVPLESERLLSIREIFGCGDSSPAGQERVVEVVPSKFPPL
ncbi:coiled-coil domain-containing protein 190 isoform X1 [Sciurus carolinensis]|uniref:coiled-coil domain-containing protein 190 isoform X1 n=1 Tax=Sciurus carolinensis TaxID=30640 RepID=UPI001FB398FD|nr:coiled-coil domain-containing protein 190 isoform X1 [Sciurus carolinensis]XP_047413133.1 coiled-coil domain-containing protein 190 isoform X1 [Sciurus carolinensis]XP_047413134.1 coiled-coil domain-containing protein 190 isoform X1 [Sciurus carolinensis]XP_047413135.1 coiled-coil domain-containing protein 190 isoform X1 [Sciurus carolinensis]